MPPGKFLKFEARKRHFLHSERRISSSNLSQKVPILDEKITKNNEKQTKTTKHFNNYDTSFSTPLVQHQNTIISLTSGRAPFTVFINREFKIYDATGSTTRLRKKEICHARQKL